MVSIEELSEGEGRDRLNISCNAVGHCDLWCAAADHVAVAGTPCVFARASTWERATFSSNYGSKVWS